MGYWIRWINRKGSNTSRCQIYWTLLEDVKLNTLATEDLDDFLISRSRTGLLAI